MANVVRHSLLPFQTVSDLGARCRWERLFTAGLWLHSFVSSADRECVASNKYADALKFTFTASHMKHHQLSVVGDMQLHCLLTCSHVCCSCQDLAPGSETTKFAHRQAAQSAEAGGLWASSGIWHPCARLHARGGQLLCSLCVQHCSTSPRP